MHVRRTPSRILVAICVVASALVAAWSAPALAQREHAFSSSFGSAGSGNGQLMRPGALAVNESTGDVYVTDHGNARVEVFGAKGEYLFQFNGSGTPEGSFEWNNVSGVAGGVETSIAVDNSADPLDPSKGDVYVMNNQSFGKPDVIDKFAATGAYLGSVTGTSPGDTTFPLGNPGGVDDLAVAPNGELWVQDGTNSTTYIYRFNDAAPVNEFTGTLTAKTRGRGGSSGGFGDVGLAIGPEAEGNFYIGLDPSESGQPMFPMKLSDRGEIVAETLAGNEAETGGMAVDLSSGDVYVDQKTNVTAYNTANLPIESFGSSQLGDSEGIAVDSTTGTVYVSDSSNQDVDIFTAFVVPDVSTEAATNLAETSATIAGVVNPDGVPITSCVFEYGTEASYGQSVPCTQTPAQIGSGNSPVAVSADLTGLERLTKYHFRLNVSNANGSNEGLDQTFITPEPVAISEESISDVSSASAQFNAQLDPGGADTTYHFEYGTSASYGQSVPVPAGEFGPATSSEPVSISIQGLLAETTYHVRLVASNLLGVTYGPDETFTTQAGGGAFSLLDGRQWEMVSPPNKGGALIDAIGGGPGFSGQIQAAATGSAMTYYASGPVGSNTVGNPNPQGETQVVSRRGADGWSSEDVTLPNNAALASHFGHEYQLFSSDLSLALVESLSETLLSSEATEITPYLHDDSDGSYVPLVTASNVTPPGTAFGSSTVQPPHVLAATPDMSHIIFESSLALTAGATPSGEDAYNIYEWSGGRFQLVNEPPVGSSRLTQVSLGGPLGNNTRGALSSDGSRVFFQAGNEKNGENVYMRNTVTDETVAVSVPAPGVAQPVSDQAEFQAASTDGSHVFFTSDEPLTSSSRLAQVPVGENGSPDLYVYDTGTGLLADLSVDPRAGEDADVQGAIVGTSENGSVVYFVATGKLAEGAQAGKDNLYVASETGSVWSAPRLVAVLSSEDANDWRGAGGLEAMSSRLAPNGRYLTFMSDQPLTGYDNRDATSGQPDEEVFVYDEAAGRLTCVSCNSTGARPQGVFEPNGNSGAIRLSDERHLWPERWVAANIPGWTPVETALGRGIYYSSRVIFDNGRMFFDSADALVPQDTNGQEDVYEYEPQGAGSCVRAGGCVALISSGTSGEESAFLDASGRGPGGEEGEDVFFLTASRLAPQDVDSSLDVYDAHECSEAAPCLAPPVSSPPCTTSDSCKAAPAPQPAIFGAPSSATFSGAGNVAPVVSKTAVVRKSLTRGQKLTAALKACKKKPRKQRAACESQARKKYGAKKSRARKSLSGKGRR